jgi:hypothetical protein
MVSGEDEPKDLFGAMPVLCLTSVGQDSASALESHKSNLQKADASSASEVTKEEVLSPPSFRETLMLPKGMGARLKIDTSAGGSVEIRSLQDSKHGCPAGSAKGSIKLQKASDSVSGEIDDYNMTSDSNRRRESVRHLQKEISIEDLRNLLNSGTFSGLNLQISVSSKGSRQYSGKAGGSGGKIEIGDSVYCGVHRENEKGIPCVPRVDSGSCD